MPGGGATPGPSAIACSALASGPKCSRPRSPSSAAELFMASASALETARIVAASGGHCELKPRFVRNCCSTATELARTTCAASSFRLSGINGSRAGAVGTAPCAGPSGASGGSTECTSSGSGPSCAWSNSHSFTSESSEPVTIKSSSTCTEPTGPAWPWITYRSAPSTALRTSSRPHSHPATSTRSFMSKPHSSLLLYVVCTLFCRQYLSRPSSLELMSSPSRRLRHVTGAVWNESMSVQRIVRASQYRIRVSPEPVTISAVPSMGSRQLT
mmetsp:Transcript_24888/g.64212  ORF Transcript_24888/g.64212 Transcript_24888/m.64212 type:complete len:271 (+) Transcript_24888:124-936(+)